MSSAISAELQTRMLTVIKLNGGRASLEQIRAERVCPGPLVTEVLRSLVSGKRLIMEGESTYSLPASNVAQSRKLAGTLSRETDASTHRAQTAVKSEPGPAEPGPRKKGSPRERSTHAPSLIACMRCRMTFPPGEFDAGPGRRRFRLCCTCGDRTPYAQGGAVSAPPESPTALGPSPETLTPSRRLEQIVERVRGEQRGKTLTVSCPAKLRQYLDKMIATGLYGSTLDECIRRMLCESVMRALEQRLIIQSTQEIDR